MLPTFVIGLREGLEAVLIVSIIATFLRRNGASMRPMWLGLAAAVALSVAVGVVLEAVQRSLPRAGQEGMETVIGLVAVFFVTGMVLWMRTHARSLKKDLEGAAEAALGDGTAWALAVMVFLAVLREGFETSVFLLATFQAASSGTAAAVGAVLGILTSIGVGYGIYRGGIRLNLARFFTVTSVFLVLVAAGLVLSSLRTAHEAGWLQAGQGRTVDLSWLAPAGSVRAALVSGVLGMPADPRVVELLGWACYLLPMLALVLWPRAWQVPARRVPAVRSVVAGVLLVAATALAVGVDSPTVAVPRSATLEHGGGATITLRDDAATLAVDHDGVTETVALAPRSSAAGVTHWRAPLPGAPADLPARLTVDQLLRYTGNRIPVGLDVHRTPGPFTAGWEQDGSVTATTYGGGLVDARRAGRLLLTLTGGGLTSPRVIEVDGADWRVDPADVTAANARIADGRRSARDAELWRWWLPAALVVVAGGLLVANLRDRRRRPALARPRPATDPTAVAPPTYRGRNHHVST